MNLRKTIIIGIILLGLASLGFGIYFAWKKTQEIVSPSPPVIPTTATTPTPLTPSTGAVFQTLKFAIISEQPAVDYWIVQQNITLAPTSTATTTNVSAQAGVYYITEKGEIYRIEDNKEDIIIGGTGIQDIRDARASFDGRRILIKSGGINNPRFTLFDVATKVSQPLSENITAATWSPTERKIAYLQISSVANESDLIIKDMADSKKKESKIISLNQEDFNLHWLNSERILLVPKPSVEYVGEIWSVDIKNKTLDLFTAGRGLMIKWFPGSGAGLRFDISSNKKESRLRLIRDNGIVGPSIDVRTFPDKCTILSPMIYCATPVNIEFSSAILPDDYLKRAILAKDVIERIDSEKDAYEKILGSDANIDAVNLSVYNNRLLFINRHDNKIYSLGL